MDISEDILAIAPELKNMKEAETLEELVEQISLIGQALERCEKMMEHLALSMKGGDELTGLMTDYKTLISHQEALVHKRSQLALAEMHAREDSTAGQRSWWQFWK